MDIHLNSKWNLITIDDPAFLPATSMVEIIHLILRDVKFEFVILDYLDSTQLIQVAAGDTTVGSRPICRVCSHVLTSG